MYFRELRRQDDKHKVEY